MSDRATLTCAELTELTGLTDRRHRQLAKEGWFPEPARGRYQRDATVKGLFEYYRESRERQRSLEDEVQRKTSAEADMREDDRDRRRGKLLQASWVEAAWSTVVVTIRQKILGISNKIESRWHPGMKGHELRKLLDTEIDEVLTELSRTLEYNDPRDREEAESEVVDAVA